MLKFRLRYPFEHNLEYSYIITFTTHLCIFKMVVQLPIILTIRNARSIIGRCQQAINTTDSEVVFDLTQSGFIDPFAVTFLVGAIKTCITREHNVIFKRPQVDKINNYLKSIGFYNLGGRSDASRFPKTQVKLRHLNAVDPGYTAAIIQVLQGILTMSPGVKDSLSLSINELMQNTFDHSEAIEGCFICAQGYKMNANICITDFGQGILKALTSVEKYKHLSNSIEAIKLAIVEGVSSRITRNAGLGLTHITRFLKVNEGEIHIISGNGWVHWNYKNGNNVIPKEREMANPFNGTIVNIIARADGEGFYFFKSEYPEGPVF